MAGTYNQKTGYLSVTGVTVTGGNIVIDGNVFDSEMIGKMITSSISNLNLDSDKVALIARNVDLNNLIDSDAITTIAQAVFTDGTIDSETINAIAVAAQSQLSVNITNLDSDVAYNQARGIRLDSDIQNVKGKYSVILSNDAIQSANIATNTADVLTLSSRITQNDSDITEIKGDVTAIYGRVTAAENENTTLDTRVDTLDTTVGITGSGGHADRITTLEANLAALQATVAALTLNSLTDVDLTTTPPTVGDVLEWNGTDWVPVATS